MTSRLRSFPLVALLAAACSALPACAVAQVGGEAGNGVSALEREHPDLYSLLVRLERANGVLFGRLLAEGEAVRATGTDIPTFEFEFEMFDELAAIADSEGTADELAASAAAGYGVLGERGAEVIERANAFHRELLGIYANPAVTDRAQAVDAAVERYLSRPEVALPAEPKDMDILYDHPYTWAFRTGYPDLGGFVWAGHWYQLAASEPLMIFDTREERLEGLETVRERFFSKLSYGEPPESFPTELPLAPPIAPLLVSAHPRAAIILDNLNMLQDVLADVLVSPTVKDVRAALDEAVAQFVDPTYRMADRYDWMVMALRHSIFNQGGPALGTMTRTERNNSGHAQHLQGGGGAIILPGMPGE
ncbi:MAG: hypothetical protein WEG36_10360 [Gemmatimonadota bacterium]